MDILKIMYIGEKLSSHKEKYSVRREGGNENDLID